MSNIEKKLRFAAPVVLSVFLLSAPTAFAQDEEKFEPEGGFFISAQAGVTLPSDSDFDGIQAPEAPSPGVAGAPAEVEAAFDNDFTFTGSVGYRIPKRIFGIFQPSVEVEYSYASPDVADGAFNGGSQSFSGGVDINTFSLNYQSDIRWDNDQRVIPFFGSGIGVADVDADIRYFPNNGIATAPTFAVRGSDTALSLQSNIGVRFVLTDQVELQARARYQRLSGLDFDRRFIAAGNDAFNADVDGRYETVSLLAGLRYNF